MGLEMCWVRRLHLTQGSPILRNRLTVDKQSYGYLKKWKKR